MEEKTRIHDVEIEVPIDSKSAGGREVPVVLQVIGVVMMVLGVIHIGLGLLTAPLLFLLGLGLIPIAIGICEIVFGAWVFKGKEKAYMPAIVIGSVALAFDLMWGNVLQALFPVAFIYVIYTHKGEFRN